MKRKLPTKELQKAALAEARTRVRTAIRQGERELHLQDLENLTELPRNIRSFSNLKTLYASKTLISDLSPLRGLEALAHIDVDNTLVCDLSDLRTLPKLEFLYLNETAIDSINDLAGSTNLLLIEFNRTAVDDISALATLPDLRYVSFAGTRVRDLSPLRGCSELCDIDLSFTEVSDLSPLKSLMKLESVEVSGTQISSLAPLSGIERLLTPSIIGGVSFAACANLPTELQAIGKLKLPGRTLGLRSYFGGSSSEEPEDDEAVLDVDLEQRPASHSFEWREDVLYAVPRQSGSFAPDVAQQIVEDFSKKLASLISSLEGNQSNPDLARVCEDILDELSDGVDAVREGVLLMRVRSLQALVFVYVESAKEQESVLASKAVDLSISSEDLLSVFSGLRVIDANRQALNFQANENNLAEFVRLSGQVISAASKSPIVSPSAVSALQYGAEEIEKLGAVIALTGSDQVRALAIEKRASIASLQALDIRNFAAAPLKKVFDEVGSLVNDSWKEARAAIPKGVGIGVQGVVSGGIKAGAAGLVTMIAGPLGGLALLIASFVPLAKAATVADVSPSDEPEAEAE